MSEKKRVGQGMSSMWLFCVALVIAASLLVGCRAAECRQMEACCAAIEAHEGVGEACGKLAQGVDKPETCGVVVETARAMFEKRGEPVPEACQ